MKIIIIHTFFSPKEARGSEIIALDTYKILKTFGHQVYFFATDKKPYIEENDWIKYFPTFYPKFNVKKIWNIEAQQNLLKMIKEVKPDIIHIHGLQDLSYSIFKSIFCYNIPVIMTIHDPGILCPARYGWDNKLSQYCKKCSGLNTLPAILNNCSVSKNKLANYKITLINFLEKISGYNKRINKFIVPSQALKDYVISREIPEKKVEVISNYLCSNFLEKIKIQNNMDYFLYVGTLGNHKGVNILLRAIKDLPSDIPFKIIGSGPHEEIYKNYVQDNNLNNVEFLGNLDRENTIRYYENCISLIVPSNYFEIFGMVNIEAFACKRPVIASRIGGIPEIVEHNTNGLLYEPASIEGLKDCIIKYWTDKDLAKQHGENGYKKLLENYLGKNYYKNLIKIYEDVLHNV